MGSTTVRPVNTREVRQWFQADPKRIERLPEAAQVTVKPKARGRLHPDAIKEHNKRRRSIQYVEGLTGKQRRDLDALRAALVAQGKAGTRGPLRKSLVAELQELQAAQG